MKALLIPDLVTECSALLVTAAFRSALETVIGRTPTQGHLCVLVAQSALESGRWRSMHRWNFGNIKASSTYEGYYCQFRCNEVIDKRLQWFDPPHPQTSFRAFQQIEVGALDHVRFLSQRKAFQPAWLAAQRGDPAEFVHALKQGGYFTADEAPYLRSVASLWGEYMRLLSGPQRDTDPAPSENEAREHAAALLAMAPDPQRWLLHTEAVIAQYESMDGVWDAIREERNADFREG